MTFDRIYLACPYTHPSAEVREQRFITVTESAARLTAQGACVYSPITMGHVLGLTETMPSDWTFWSKHCLSFIQHWATVVLVLKLDGWDESIGVSREVEAARSENVPVVGILPVPDNWREIVTQQELDRQRMTGPPANLEQYFAKEPRKQELEVTPTENRNFFITVSRDEVSAA